MNIYHGLLLQKGYIVDPKLVVLLSREPAAPEPAPVTVTVPRHRSLGSRLRWLLEEMRLLGGRPLPRDRYDDIDEPFPPLHGCS